MSADRDERTRQYFDEAPDVASERERIDVVLPDVSFSMETDRGVFAHGRLDTGTSLLLRQPLELPTTGDLLDLGCGAGAIALTMARRSPNATVWAVDVNRRALELCRHNAERNRISNVRAVDPDDMPAELTLAAIWSNPPIRIGKDALHELLEHWLARLDTGAAAVLVVQRHLGADSLQRWLTAAGYDTTRLASKAGYRVIRAVPQR